MHWGGPISVVSLAKGEGNVSVISGIATNPRGTFPPATGAKYIPSIVGTPRVP